MSIFETPDFQVAAGGFNQLSVSRDNEFDILGISGVTDIGQAVNEFPAIDIN